MLFVGSYYGLLRIYLALSSVSVLVCNMSCFVIYHYLANRKDGSDYNDHVCTVFPSHLPGGATLFDFVIVYCMLTVAGNRMSKVNSVTCDYVIVELLS